MLHSKTIGCILPEKNAIRKIESFESVSSRYKLKRLRSARVHFPLQKGNPEPEPQVLVSSSFSASMAHNVMKRLSDSIKGCVTRPPPPPEELAAIGRHPSPIDWQYSKNANRFYKRSRLLYTGRQPANLNGLKSHLQLEVFHI